MAASPDYINLEQKKLAEILDKAKDWAVAHGITMKVGGNSGHSEVQHAPFALFPSAIPSSLLRQVSEAMPHFSRLMHRVAHDYEFLESSLKNVIEVDKFTEGLWNIYKKVKDEGFAQPYSLGLFRNDFMIDCKGVEASSTAELIASEKLDLKQVEFNTIASSFGGLVSQLTHLHRFSMDSADIPYKSSQIPDNDPALELSRGLLEAWRLYVKEFGKSKQLPVIVFIVSGGERNIFDQRWLEFKLYFLDRHVKVRRQTFQDITNLADLQQDKSLWINGEEVAVVYYRAGYEPDAYPTEKEWSARLMLERSTAIKCPSIHLQLAGTKKVQQELSRPGTVERFLTESSAVNVIRGTFAALYSLDLGPEGDAAVELAMTSPENYVLKPQREGGGNNLYGADMTACLEKIRDSTERNAFILMERIHPLIQKNYLIKTGIPVTLANTVNELGIYGIYLGSAKKEIVNSLAGHMVRTKTQGTNEGGVMAGFAALDTPFLV